MLFQGKCAEFRVFQHAVQAVVAKFCRAMDAGSPSRERMDGNLFVTDTAHGVMLHTASSEYEEMIAEMLSNRLGTSSSLW